MGKEFLLSKEPRAVVSISVRCEAGDSCRRASVSLAIGVGNVGFVDVNLGESVNDGFVWLFVVAEEGG